MLSCEQRDEIEFIVRTSLDECEKVWKDVGHTIAFDEAASEKLVKREVSPSRIPGHSFVHSDVPKVEKFIALVADMRKSSNHLLCAISGTRASMLERVFYETSSMLPAIERTVEYSGGAVTEYLGDGVLSLFKVHPDKKYDAIYASHRAAKNCIGDTRDIINRELASRYRLPPIDIGVGLGMSDAIVSLVGLSGQKHPKVFGKCVYYASKLSGGTNHIYVDETMNNSWPSEKGGTLKFTKRPINGVDGYLLSS